MRAREQDTGRLSAKATLSRGGPLAKIDVNAGMVSKAPAKVRLQSRSGAVKLPGEDKVCAHDENVKRDPNHGVSLADKPKLSFNIYDNLAQTKAGKTNEQGAGARVHRRTNSGVPLNTKTAVAPKKTSAGENVPNQGLALKQAKSVAKAPRSAMITPGTGASVSREAKVQGLAKPVSLVRPTAFGPGCAPRKPGGASSYMISLEQQYEELCQLEQQKLRKLEGIITRKQKIDMELTELARGKAPAK